MGGELNTDNTVGTLFIAMPPAVQTLGRGGDFVVGAFFVMLFFAALTSAISLLEVVVSAAIDGLGWSRRRAALAAGATIALAGVPSTISLGFLDVMDKFVGTVLLMLGGLFTSILVGYKILPQADAELAQGMESATARRAWSMFVRYVAPPVLAVVLLFSIPKMVVAVRALVGG